MQYNLMGLLRDAQRNQKEIKGVWWPARPVAPSGLFGLKVRIKAAWLVLTGKADAVIWPAEQ